MLAVLRRGWRVMLLLVVAGVLLGWLAGQALSDRTGWSQWLAWIPLPAALLAAVVGWATTARRPGPGHRRSARPWWRRIAWPALVAAIAIFGAVVEHRFLRLRAPEPRGLSVLHWNMTAARGEPLSARAAALPAHAADVMILSHAGAIAADPAVARWLQDGHTHYVLFPFTIFTSRPIVEIRWLVATDSIRVAQLVVSAGDETGRTLSLWMVDLPSNPRQPRMDLARRTHRLLEQVGATWPDLIVGDFNITRGSAALHHLAPGYRHAFDLAGRGYGATFPRAVPLYHIDHILAAPDVTVGAYRIINPGAGRHRMQEAVVE